MNQWLIKNLTSVFDPFPNTILRPSQIKEAETTTEMRLSIEMRLLKDFKI